MSKIVTSERVSDSVMEGGDKVEQIVSGNIGSGVVTSG